MTRKRPERTGPRPVRGKARPAEGRTFFGRTNWLILGGGLLSIILGYVLLAKGSLSVAPVLLVLGYCFLLPFSLIWRPRTSGGEPAGRSGYIETKSRTKGE